MRDLTKKQFLAALQRIGWRVVDQDVGAPFRHEETKTTSYGPDGMSRRQTVEYLDEVAKHRRRVGKL